MDTELPSARLRVFLTHLCISTGSLSLFRRKLVSEHGTIALSRTQQKIMEHVMLAPGTPRQEMIEYVYEDAETSPVLEAETLAVHIGILRRRLNTIGYTITCQTGRGRSIFGCRLMRLGEFEPGEPWKAKTSHRKQDSSTGKFTRVDNGV